MLADGKEVKGVVRVDVTSNNWYQADRFSAEVALSADPTLDFKETWDDKTTILIEIYMGFLPTGSNEGSVSDWQLILSGEVDHMQLELQEKYLRIDGRDLTARMIEHKTHETYANNTSSEVATKIAQENDLTPHVKDTTTKVGQYYQLEHDKTTLNNFSHSTNQWDLLTYLAQQEGFDVFVQGNDLYFQPRTEPDSDPFVVRYLVGDNELASPTMTVSAIRPERSLTIAKDVQVEVKTWNSKKKKSFVVTKKAKGANTPGAQKQPVQNYVFVKPNMTPEDADRFADAMIKEITRHERIVNITMPGELKLTPRTMLKLEGTGTSYDQVYFVDEISRTMSFDGGFQQRVRCRNTSPRTESAGSTTVL
jgi:phage protein D